MTAALVTSDLLVTGAVVVYVIVGLVAAALMVRLVAAAVADWRACSTGRRAERARADVAARDAHRCFQAGWQAGEHGQVLPFERSRPAEVIEFPRDCGGWRK